MATAGRTVADWKYKGLCAIGSRFHLTPNGPVYTVDFLQGGGIQAGIWRGSILVENRFVSNTTTVFPLSREEVEALLEAKPAA